MSLNITTTPPWFRSTSKQGLWINDHITQISLNNMNINSKFERKIKTYKKTLKMRLGRIYKIWKIQVFKFFFHLFSIVNFRS